MVDLNLDICNAIVTGRGPRLRQLAVEVNLEISELLRDEVAMWIRRNSTLLTLTFYSEGQDLASNHQTNFWLEFLARILAGPSIQLQVRFRRLGFDPAGSDRLSQIFGGTSRLSALSFIRCTFQKPIERFPPRLQTLSLHDVPFEQIFREDVSLTSLQYLNWGMAKPTPEGLGILTQLDLPSLQRLRVLFSTLASVVETNAFLGWLGSKNLLQELTLVNWRVLNHPEPIFESLTFPALRQFKLERVILAPAQIQSLADWIARHPHLRQLDLGRNLSVDWPVLGQGLKVWDSVERLCFDTILFRRGLSPHYQEFQSYLGSTRTLVRIDLHQIHCPTQADWEAMITGIQGNSSLQHLCLKGFSCGHQVELGPGLKTLLSQNRMLRSLSLESAGINDWILISILEGLQANSTLQTINLSQNRFDDLGLEKLYQMIGTHSSIRKWILNHNESVGRTLEQLGAAVARNPQIELLGLINLKAPAGQMDAFLTQLHGHPGLTRLDLFDNRWAVEPLTGLLGLLHTAPQLLKLGLGLVDMTTVQLDALAAAMDYNSTLRQLAIYAPAHDFKRFTIRNKHNQRSRETSFFQELLSLAFDLVTDDSN